MRGVRPDQVNCYDLVRASLDRSGEGQEHVREEWRLFRELCYIIDPSREQDRKCEERRRMSAEFTRRTLNSHKNGTFDIFIVRYAAM